MELLALHINAFCPRLESCMVIDIGAWSDHTVVRITEFDIFWRMYLSVRNKSILEYELCLEEKKVKSRSEP